MTVLISPKLRSDVKKVMERKNTYTENARKEFLQKKKSEGIEINEKMLISDANTVLELNRYSDIYTNTKRKDLIPSSVNFEPVDANGVPAEWVTPSDAASDKVVFYLFGGAYVIGTIETRRILTSLISDSSKIRAFLVGYRLAPEHPFPAALNDSITAYKWLLSNGIKAQNIVCAGSSAGGGLTVATLLKLKELSLPLPAGAVLLSPWTDLALRGESMKLNEEYEPELSKAILRMTALVYSGGANRKNPLISPIYADLTGLPPLLIHAGNIETLRDDSVRLAERAKEAGVDVTLEVWEDMPHVFHNYVNEIPESKKAIEKIGQYIRMILT
jgi:acetyl esterase/lipase